MRNDRNGLTKEYRRLYKIWHGMKSRCENPDIAQFANYGGRGIRVVEEWQSLEMFISWSLKWDTTGKSIDRIDNDGPYAPWNCRWATSKQQARNRSTTNSCELKGVRMSLPDAADLGGIALYNLRRRVVKERMPIEEAISRKIKSKDGLLTAFGETRLLSEWASSRGIKRELIRMRLRRGMSVERALSTDLEPAKPKKKLIKIGSRRKTIEDWCAELSITEATFHRRRRLGLDVLAPKGPTGPKPETIYRVRPGPKGKT